MNPPTPAASPPPLGVNWEPAERIARAVLYEGYLLYPYRASSLKNRKRWTFGTVEPGGSVGTEVLVESVRPPRVAVRLRCLREGEEKEAPLEARVEACGEGLYKVGVRVEARDEPLVSCHALLGVEDGAFVSMTDPRSAVCRRNGFWPVLVRSDLVLASPILLPDHPRIAPESPGDLFDGTEIDEILSLRIRTLGDGEKEEIRRGDARARRLLERTEALSADDLRALHGAKRDFFRAGDRVRLRPRGRADILDLALDGKEATVVAVEEDLEGRRYVAVTVADDPGSDLGREGFPGHRFFFRPEEVEPL
jgi:hypothetical protein